MGTKTTDAAARRRSTLVAHHVHGHDQPEPVKRKYYAVDHDTGRIVTWMHSPLDLAEHVAKMRAAGSRHDWTANPTTEQLDELDRRLADGEV